MANLDTFRKVEKLLREVQEEILQTRKSIIEDMTRVEEKFSVLGTSKGNFSTQSEEEECQEESIVPSVLVDEATEDSMNVEIPSYLFTDEDTDEELDDSSDLNPQLQEILETRVTTISAAVYTQKEESVEVMNFQIQKAAKIEVSDSSIKSSYRPEVLTPHQLFDRGKYLNISTYISYSFKNCSAHVSSLNLLPLAENFRHEFLYKLGYRSISGFIHLIDSLSGRDTEIFLEHILFDIKSVRNFCSGAHGNEEVLHVLVEGLHLMPLGNMSECDGGSWYRGVHCCSYFDSTCSVFDRGKQFDWSVYMDHCSGKFASVVLKNLIPLFKTDQNITGSQLTIHRSRSSRIWIHLVVKGADSGDSSSLLMTMSHQDIITGSNLTFLGMVAVDMEKTGELCLKVWLPRYILLPNLIPPLARLSDISRVQEYRAATDAHPIWICLHNCYGGGFTTSYYNQLMRLGLLVYTNSYSFLNTYVSNITSIRMPMVAFLTIRALLHGAGKIPKLLELPTRVMRSVSSKFYWSLLVSSFSIFDRGKAAASTKEYSSSEVTRRHLWSLRMSFLFYSPVHISESYGRCMVQEVFILTLLPSLWGYPPTFDCGWFQTSHYTELMGLCTLGSPQYVKGYRVKLLLLMLVSVETRDSCALNCGTGREDSNCEIVLVCSLPISTRMSSLFPPCKMGFYLPFLHCSYSLFYIPYFAQDPTDGYTLVVDSWSLGRSNGAVLFPGELPRGPNTMECIRLLFDRGRMLPLSFWNTHIYCTVLNDYGSMHRVTRNCAVGFGNEGNVCLLSFLGTVDILSVHKEEDFDAIQNVLQGFSLHNSVTPPILTRDHSTEVLTHKSKENFHFEKFGAVTIVLHKDTGWVYVFARSVVQDVISVQILFTAKAPNFLTEVHKPGDVNYKSWNWCCRCRMRVQLEDWLTDAGGMFSVGQVEVKEKTAMATLDHSPIGFRALGKALPYSPYCSHLLVRLFQYKRHYLRVSIDKRTVGTKNLRAEMKFRFVMILMDPELEQLLMWLVSIIQVQSSKNSRDSGRLSSPTQSHVTVPVPTTNTEPDFKEVTLCHLNKERIWVLPRKKVEVGIIIIILNSQVSTKISTAVHLIRNFEQLEVHGSKEAITRMPRQGNFHVSQRRGYRCDHHPICKLYDGTRRTISLQSWRSRTDLGSAIVPASYKVYQLRPVRDATVVFIFISCILEDKNDLMGWVLSCPIYKLSIVLRARRVFISRVAIVGVVSRDWHMLVLIQSAYSHIYEPKCNLYH